MKPKVRKNLLIQLHKATLRSKRPGRRSAGSNKSLRFVAARNMTPFPVSKPSSSINNWFNVVSLSWVAALYSWSEDSLKIPWRLPKHKFHNQVGWMLRGLSKSIDRCSQHHQLGNYLFILRGKSICVSIENEKIK